MMQNHIKTSLYIAMAFLIMPFSAGAVQVNGVSLQKSPAGDVVTIQADAPLTYELFDLTAPARLVINIPGASLKNGLEPLHDDSHEGVNNVFPIVSGKDVRIEIGMDHALSYKASEKGNSLIVRFAATTAGTKKNGAAPSAILKDIDIHDRGPVTELVLRGDHMDASHDAFVSNHGRTLILDLWGATSMLRKEHYAVATQKVRDVTVGHAAGRVRLVVNLVAGGTENHQITASGQRMVVRFGDVAAGRKSSVVKVEDVHFQPDDRVAHVQIRTDVTNPIVNIYEKQGNVVLDIKKASLAAGQQRTQDVRDFPGPVKQVDAYSVGNQVRIVARLREKADVSSYQQGNVLTLTLTPKDIAAARRGVKGGGKLAYTGQKVTFDFKDIDIQNALKLIAEMSDLNIIMADDVKGKLTMHLVDVPWDQALDLILAARGLGKVRTGNVMRIAPAAVLQAENAARLKAQKTTRNLEPLVTEFISLSYAKVADVEKILAGAKNSGAGSGKGGTGTPSGSIGLSSPRGSVLVDERTNTLIIHDTQAVINNIKRMIAKIDWPQKQVLISARIVEASDSFSRDIGVRWGGSFNQTTRRNFPGAISVGSSAANTAANVDAITTAGKTSTASLTRGFLVDLPAVVGAGAGGAIGLSLGSFSKVLNLDLELSAAEADGAIKIVSSPRVMTIDNKPALISQGQDIPFVTPGSANNPPTVTTSQAVLSLSVTPQITPDHHVLMLIDVKKDAPTASSVQGNPIIDTKNINTSVFVNNGETIVIGGIYTRDQQNTTNAVPGLSRIPILGWLFRKNLKQDNKTELLIFITPTIIQEKNLMEKASS